LGNPLPNRQTVRISSPAEAWQDARTHPGLRLDDLIWSHDHLPLKDLFPATSRKVLSLWQMIRTRVQLTEAQMKALRHLSASTGKSIADLVRQGVDRYLSTQVALRPQERIERASCVVSKFRSGKSDVSTDHDRYLAEAYR
jgi:hypothetical protein